MLGMSAVMGLGATVTFATYFFVWSWSKGKTRKVFPQQTHVFCGVCRDKIRLLSQQTYFASTNIFCCDKHDFVAASILLVFRDKIMFVPRKYICRDKSRVLSRQTRVVAAKLLSRQTYVCRDKNMFVAPSILLSRRVLCDKARQSSIDTCGSSR